MRRTQKTISFAIYLLEFIYIIAKHDADLMWFRIVYQMLTTHTHTYQNQSNHCRHSNEWCIKTAIPTYVQLMKTGERSSCETHLSFSSISIVLFICCQLCNSVSTLNEIENDIFCVPISFSCHSACSSSTRQAVHPHAAQCTRIV